MADPRFARRGHLTYYYRPQRSCGQGYVFTRVCDSVHRGWVSGQGEPPGRENPPAGRTPPGRETFPPEQTIPTPGSRHITPRQGDAPWEQTPPGRDTPQEQTPQPPRADSPREADCSIRSMSSRYASYWNAFLFCKCFAENCMEMKEFDPKWEGVGSMSPLVDH